MIYVLYHAFCQDGLGSKFAAWKKFGDAATYIPAQYGKPLPLPETGLEDSEVFILDFSYDRATLEALQARVMHLQVLDHHKTAEEALRGLNFAFFDMKKSGAVLSWEYFHPGTPVPDLLLSIQDRDLWNWKRPGTREVLSALRLVREDFEKWEKLAAIPLDDEFLNKWSNITTYEDDYVERRCKEARFIRFYGKKAAVYNTTLLVSEIGNKLCETTEIDFAIGYFINDEGKVCISFRSVGDFDVSVIAAGYGGGGHKNAAGAIVSLSVLEQLYW